MTFASYLFAFVVLLSVLIFVHELGHFLVAKACGVRVLKFSLGFGPPIGFGRYRLRWKRGHTEYVAAWFPMGGFVKMLGESPSDAADEEDRAHPGEALNAKPTWQRLAIVFAGPAMNLCLPIAVFAITLAVGLPRAAPVIGMVEEDSPAERAGLAAGDRLTAVDGEPLLWWGDLDEFVRERAGRSLTLSYERGEERREARLEIASRSGFDQLGRVGLVGWAGLLHSRPRPMLGIADAASPAHVAGLRSGDVVTAVNGESIEDWYDFAAAYARAAGPVEIALERGPEDPRQVLAFEAPALGDVAALGVEPANVLVAQVEPDSAADGAGIRPGDLILTVDGEPVRSFDSFAETISTSGGRTFELLIAREGQLVALEVAPELIPTDVGLGIEQPRYRIGIRGQPMLMGEVGLDQERNPLVAIPRAVSMTVDTTRTILDGFAQLFSGDIAFRKQIAGPIGIAEIAGKALQRGWETYLSIMVVISINLAIVNLLPIPILDGGQALIIAVEGIKRAPLSLRTREFVQQIGFTVILLLLGLAFWNDISRNWSKVLDWLRSGQGL